MKTAFSTSPIPHSRGFTLLEMIVATSVFIVAALIIVGGLVSLNNASRKARAARIVTDNLSAAIDSMSRNIRMGSAMHCGCGTAGVPSTAGDTSFPGGARDCPLADGGDVCLAFEGPQGDGAVTSDQVVYRLSGNRIERSIDGGATYIALTAPEMKVNDLHFYVDGTFVDQDQPVVTMVLRAEAQLGTRTKTDFDIETTVSPRTPNFSSP